MKSSLLLDLCQANLLCQLVTEPTRDNNILDLVLTNDPQLVSSLNVLEQFSTSDHNAILFKICYSANQNAPLADYIEFIEYFNWQGGNWEEFAT